MSLTNENQDMEYGFTNSSSVVKNINTTDISPGNYTILSDGKHNGTQIEITNTSLSAEIPVAATRSNISMSVAPIKTDRHLISRLYDENGTVRAVSEERIREGQEGETTFEAPKKGEYEIQIEDIDTGGTESQSMAVLNRHTAVG